MAHEYVQLDTNTTSGAKIAVDRINDGSNDIEYQLVQLVLGADGSAKTIAGLAAAPFGVRLSDGSSFIAPALEGGNLASILTALQGTLTVDGSGVTQPVSAASLPLPTGAATAANQSTANGLLGTIDTDTGAIAAGFAAEGSALGSGVLLQGDDGTDRTNVLVDTDGHVQIDVLTLPSISGTVTANAGTNLNTSLLALESGGNLATIAGDTTSIDGKITACNTGAVVISSALPAGTNNIGDVDILTIAAGTNLIGDVGLQPRTSGGLTMHKTTSAASTNATSLKASAGQVYSIQCFNVNAAVRYLKLYNKASAPTVGTDTPVKTLAIPGNTAGAGFVISWPQGLAFDTGIAFALTTEATDAGTTGVAANEITVNIDYK